MQAINQSALTYRPDPATSAQRAGIIPYKLDTNGRVYWLLGRKFDSTLTDFGGGCKERFHETPVDCALRELREELSNNNPTTPIYRLIREIELNIFNPQVTSIYLARAARAESPIRRYIFYINTNASWDIVRNFRPTSEIESIQWVDPTTINRSTKLNPSIIEWIVFWQRYLRRY